MPWQIWMFGLRNAVDQEQKTETEHASGFHSRETLYLNAFMLIYFLTFNTYKYAFPLFPFLLIWQWRYEVVETSCYFIIVNFLVEMFLKNVILVQIKSSLWQKLSQSLSAVKGPGPPEIQSLKEKYVGSRVSSAEWQQLNLLSVQQIQNQMFLEQVTRLLPLTLPD